MEWHMMMCAMSLQPLRAAIVARAERMSEAARDEKRAQGQRERCHLHRWQPNFVGVERMQPEPLSRPPMWRTSPGWPARAAQVADWARLAGAWGNLRRDPA